ncbi:MAG: hypothetical protein VW771_02880, partial [Gammaproteobacteria bacterium]
RKIDPGKVIVLIDQGFTSHPDRFLIPDRAGISFEGTYRPLVDFLRHLSTIFDATIKVAAHPKASLAETIKIFSDFEVTSEDTMEMISAADLVVTHSSTAIQWAVFFNKPIVLFSTPELDESRLGPTAAGFVEQFNARKVDICQEYQWIDERTFDIDHFRYAAYRRNFVKGSASSEMSLKDIVISNL